MVLITYELNSCVSSHAPGLTEGFKGRMSRTDMLCRWQLVIGRYLACCFGWLGNVIKLCSL